ncbi:MAG: hypothetical protein EOM19_07100, partial [Candidatus Moranbacteria bacterium]|nr:hypothetical protein [Candidatus Moranbacteria bacterium]
EGVGYLESVSQISVGQYHTCATKTDGTAYCWGSNFQGKLGDGTSFSKLTPVQVKGVGNAGYLQGVSQISAGDSHACATKTDGTAYCWGDNAYGRLGDNTTTQRLTPVQVLGVGGMGFLGSVTAIATSDRSSCALLENTSLWCWGSNYYGELGADSAQSSFPVQVQDATGMFSDPISQATQINTQTNTSCFRKTNGTVWCWGENTYGQIGDNTMGHKPGAVQVKGVDGVGYLTDIAQVANGENHTCALKNNDGTVYCWGYNNYGQLGDNTTTNRSTPVQVLGVGGSGVLEGISQVSAGNSHTCATKTDGTAYCWGYNQYGRLGDNTTTNRSTPVQVLGVGGVGFFEGISQVSAGNYHTCALKTDGTVFCWGRNDYEQLASDTSSNSLTPLQAMTYIPPSGYLTGIQQISGGLVFGNYCALKNDGTVFCWGRNLYGQLGDNTTTQRLAPVQVKGVGNVGNLSGVSQISSGSTHTCATKNDGTAYCWGRNSSGQLGDTTTEQRNTPVEVIVSTNISRIIQGRDFTCTLKTDATLECWGSNSSGQLGDRTYTTRSTPVRPQIWSTPENDLFLGVLSDISLTGTYTSPVFDLTKPVVFTDTSFTHTLNNQNL